MGFENAQLDQGIVRIAQEVATNAARNAIARSPEISALKEDVTRLKEGQRRIEKDVAGLKEGQRRIEKDVAGLKEGQRRIEKDVTGLKTGLQKNTDMLVQVLNHIKAQGASAQEPG